MVIRFLETNIDKPVAAPDHFWREKWASTFCLRKTWTASKASEVALCAAERAPIFFVIIISRTQDLFTILLFSTIFKKLKL